MSDEEELTQALNTWIDTLDPAAISGLLWLRTGFKAGWKAAMEEVIQLIDKIRSEKTDDR